MKPTVLSLLLALALVAAGCGPDPFVRPERNHEVHMTPYAQGPMAPQAPPGGPPMGPPPSPPAGSGPVGEPPSPNHIWIPGYHAYQNQSWYWVPGGWWVPEGRKSWIPGRWVPAPGGGAYYWQKGHWQ